MSPELNNEVIGEVSLLTKVKLKPKGGPIRGKWEWESACLAVGEEEERQSAEDLKFGV